MPYKLFLLFFLSLFIVSCGNKSFRNDGVVAVNFKRKIYKTNHASHQSNQFASQLANTTQQAKFQPSLDNSSAQTKAILYKVQKKWSRTPYVLGGSSLRGADCSGFVQSVYRDEFGIRLPRTTPQLLRSGAQIPISRLCAGDLVFFATGARPHGHHVGIYISNGLFVHLSSYGGAKIQNLSMPYWRSKYIGARRYR